MTPLLPLALAIMSSTDPPPGARVVMPASGVVIEGLPTEATRWEPEGTLLVGARDARPIDRLLAWSDTAERLVTIEIRRTPCPAPPPPGTVSPWPTLGYAGIRAALPERRAVRSCKAPDLLLELRFPAGVATDPDLLLAAADTWEPAVTAIHRAYGATRVDLLAAAAQRDKLAFEPTDDAPPDTLARLTAPLTLRSGLAFDRAADRLPWVVRDLGGHDVLTLLAPTAAALALQLLPFSRRYTCDDALAAALKSHPPPPADTPPPRLPPGWHSARALGPSGAAFCIATPTGGLVAIGGARVPRETWLPLASAILGRLGERLTR